MLLCFSEVAYGTKYLQNNAKIFSNVYIKGNLWERRNTFVTCAKRSIVRSLIFFVVVAFSQKFVVDHTFPGKWDLAMYHKHLSRSSCALDGSSFLRNYHFEKKNVLRM